MSGTEWVWREDYDARRFAAYHRIVRVPDARRWIHDVGRGAVINAVTAEALQINCPVDDSRKVETFVESLPVCLEIVVHVSDPLCRIVHSNVRLAVLVKV